MAPITWETIFRIHPPSVKIDLSAIFRPPSSILPRFWAPTLRQSNSSPSNDVASTVVTLSDAARRAAAAVKLAPTEEEAKTATELRDLIRQYDFHSITPRQMANLGGELFKRREISQEAACSFIGVEMNTVVEMDPDQPIDMIAHFKRMQDVVEEAARTDSTLSYAVTYRQIATQAFADVMSFARSGRLHVSR